MSKAVLLPQVEFFFYFHALAVHIPNVYTCIVYIHFRLSTGYLSLFRFSIYKLLLCIKASSIYMSSFIIFFWCLII
jgi:hypothetical protein